MVKKGFYFLILLLVTRILVSCWIFSCPDPEILEMTVNNIEIESFDNSYASGYYYGGHTDSVTAGAIGFNIAFSDTTKREYCYYCSNLFNASSLGIMSAMAMQECDQYEFELKPKLKSMQVKTIFDFSEEIKSGDNIDSIIVCNSRFLGLDDEIYYQKDEMIKLLSDVEIYHDPEFEFEIYLKKSPSNDSLKLLLEFVFDDGSMLIDSSSTVFPKY